MICTVVKKYILAHILKSSFYYCNHRCCFFFLLFQKYASGIQVSHQPQHLRPSPLVRRTVLMSSRAPLSLFSSVRFELSVQDHAVKYILTEQQLSQKPLRDLCWIDRLQATLSIFPLFKK